MKRQRAILMESQKRAHHIHYSQERRMKKLQCSWGTMFILDSRAFHILDWRCVLFFTSICIYHVIFPARLPHPVGLGSFEQEWKLCAPILVPKVYVKLNNSHVQGEFFCCCYRPWFHTSNIVFSWIFMCTCPRSTCIFIHGKYWVCIYFVEYAWVWLVIGTRIESSLDNTIYSFVFRGPKQKMMPCEKLYSSIFPYIYNGIEIFFIP